MRKAALILDPEWRLQAIDPNQYQVHVKTQLGQLPPIDFLMTACSRDDEHWITSLFTTYQGWQQQSSNPNPHPASVPSPHFPANPNGISRWKNWLNYKLLSSKLVEFDKKTKQQVPVPGRILVNTSYGLMNANAGVDAVTRMLTNTKHKIDQIIIIDPHNVLNSPVHHITSHVCITAASYAAANPHIPLAVIT